MLHDTSYCLIEVVTKAGLTVYIFCPLFILLSTFKYKKMMN